MAADHHRKLATFAVVKTGFLGADNAGRQVASGAAG